MFWLFLLPLWLFAYEGSEKELIPDKPWFTGPLIAASGNTTAAGHVNFEPYFYAINRQSFYNNDWESEEIDTLWNLQFRMPLWIGITDWMDVKIVPGWNFNMRNGVKRWSLADVGVQLDFALHKDSLPHKHWYPSIKVSVRENFPTGKYQQLKLEYFGTDAGGRGSYTTFVGLSASKLLRVRGDHFLNLFLNAAYGFPTTVHVKGFNVYGGGQDTDGVVSPEKIFLGVLAFEYSLTRNWAIACDFQAVVMSSIGFQGDEGFIPSDDPDVNPYGLPAANEAQAAIHYTIAPAIEYNWSANLGLIAGVWFTVAGKNASNFTAGVLALNYYH